MKRLSKILAILMKADPNGYLSAYNDSISLAKGVDPSNFSKEDRRALSRLGCRWLKEVTRAGETHGGYWITCW
jgi:hypothetical protein